MNHRSWLVIGLFVLILLTGCTSFDKSNPVPNTDKNFSAPNVNPKNNETGTKTEVNSLTIPKGSIALFYTSGLGSVSKNLNVFEGDGTIHTVKFDSSSRAMMMYIPELELAKTMKIYTSQSYSQNVVYPYVAGERFFVLRDWGSDWEIKNDRWTLEELDVYTGKLTSTSDFSGSGFAVVGNKIYFNTNKKLRVIEIGGNGYYADELQSSYVGRIYGVGANLVSLFVEGSQGQYTFSIRTHDLTTGAVTKTWYSGINYDLSEDQIFPGETALYQVVSEGTMRYIYIYPINGESSRVLEFPLASGEADIYVAEDDGYLAILVESTTSKGKQITKIILYHLATAAEEEIPLEAFSASSSYRTIGTPFLILN